MSGKDIAAVVTPSARKIKKRTRRQAENIEVKQADLATVTTTEQPCYSMLPFIWTFSIFVKQGIWDNSMCGSEDTMCVCVGVVGWNYFPHYEVRELFFNRYSKEVGCFSVGCLFQHVSGWRGCLL